MIRTILAAVDGSARAVGVLNLAVEIAAPLHAHVHLFTAVWLAPELPPAAHVIRDNLEKVIVEQAYDRLARMAAAFPGVAVETPRLTDTEPWRAILDAATRIEADLIAIGSHGYGGWDRLLGTTAAQVANRANRHVWIVHEPHRPPGVT